MSRKIVLILVVVVALGVLFVGCHGCHVSGKNASQQKATVAETQQQAKVEKTEAKTEEANKAIMALQKQVVDLQQQLAEAKKAPTTVVAPVAPRPNPEVMRVLESQAGSNNNDMVLHMWTGRPAVIHELNAARGSDTQARIDPSAAKASYTKDELADAKEKELQRQDRMEYLRSEIRNAGCSIIQTKKFGEACSDLSTKAWSRKNVAETLERIEKMKKEMSELKQNQP
jgi:hypothetical protein